MDIDTDRGDVTSEPTRPTVIAGNVTNKHGGNPLMRLIVRRFDRRVLGFVEGTNPDSVLDVGCGEGEMTNEFAARLSKRRVVGLDLNDDGSLNAHWDEQACDNVEYVVGSAEALPFADGEFDMVTAIESFEHVARPDDALQELIRVAR